MAQVFSCKIFKNTYFYRTPLVAASELRSSKIKLTKCYQESFMCIYCTVRNRKIVIVKLLHDEKHNSKTVVKNFNKKFAW